ncbi:MAG: PDDEXK family nuclease [Candidatus Dormibacteria bacterium]
MKLIDITVLIDTGGVSEGERFKDALATVKDAVAQLHWPEGGQKFTINPSSGRSTGQANGVKPIKQGFCLLMSAQGWGLEWRYRPGDDAHPSFRPGAYDCSRDLGDGEGVFVVEWETGNISSSHRALNKMALGLIQGWLSAGILVLPSRNFYRYLTDRVGNFREIEGYFPLWRGLNVERGYLAVIEVEHDATDEAVPQIKKGTDGRALV